MKALLLDVGNSYMKWGVADAGIINRTGQIAQQKIREQGLGVLTSRLPRRVDAVMASNVAGPSFATRLAGVIGAHCGCDIRFAKTGRAAYGVTNRYTQPRRMGVDRWVAMIGAWAEIGKPCMVVDAGTAVTIDAISADGQHLGGQIFPGVQLMARALASDTSDIPTVTTKKSAVFDGMDMFAVNTRDAVNSGALSAVVGGIERSFATFKSNTRRPTLVLTGGDASRILKALGVKALHRPNLVLQGLLHMLGDE